MTLLTAGLFVVAITLTVTLAFELWVMSRGWRQRRDARRRNR